jgi:uncharacterized repeat protein (TIGR02543 family)
MFVNPVLSAQVTLLNDGFEISPYFQNWNDNGTTNWTSSPSFFHSGLRSVRAANNSEGFLTSDDLDTSDAKSVVVDFWFRKTSIDPMNFSLYYFDGSNYDLIVDLNSLGGEDTWLHYTDTITDPQYFTSNFRVRFDATMNSNEKVYVDDVLITKDTGETLEVFKSGTGSGTVTSSPAGIDCGTDCTENFATGTVVTLTATPASGSLFAGWSGASCSGTGTCVVTMDAARSVTANFEPGALLTISKNGSGSGTVTSNPVGVDCGLDCEETYNYSTIVTLTAIPAAGSIFSGWSGAGCSGTGTCVITMDAARSVTATFEPGYTLSVYKNGAGSGTVTSSPAGIDCGLDCNEDYGYNTEVTLTATADAGSTFSGWSGAGCSGLGACSVTMTVARSVTASFAQDQYTLTTDKIGQGSVGKSPDQATYLYDDMVTLTATADPGWTFNSWSGGLTGSTNPDTVIIQGNIIVTATFTQDQYTLATNVTGQGSVDISPDQATYVYDDEVNLTATANPGWNFVGWSGDITSTENPLQVTIQDNTSVTATFTMNSYSLGIGKDGTGSGTVTSDPPGIHCGLDCSEDYDYNTVVTLTAVADTGSTFTSWNGGGCTGTGTCEVTMNEAKSVTATFTLNTYTLSVSNIGTGIGIVTSSPVGINCESDCSDDYDYNTVVTLTAVADVNSTFMGWSGAGCSGMGTCVVTMDAAKFITAEFTQTNFPIFLPLIVKP